MKSGIAKKILIAGILTVMMLFIVACTNGKVEQATFDVSLKCGYGNSVEIGTYVPFYVEITNNGENFEGAVQMIVPGRDDHNVMYQKELSIQHGATKTVELIGYIEILTRQVNIRILDNNENVIWSSLQNCSTLTDLRNVNVGILSDDYSALGYMDRRPFTENKELTTQIFELTQSTFPSDWRALDMLDVVVISDFSTDMLSEEQLNALALWVNDGGLLMVGTGSTSSKTLAKLNGNLFNVQIGDLQSYNTKFGLTVADFDYNYGDSYYYDPYSDRLYETFYEQNYDAIRDELEAEFMDDFSYDYGYNPSYHTWDTYWEDSFYWYCFDEYYEIYLDSMGNTDWEIVDTINGMPYVKADVLSLSGDMIEDLDTYCFQGEDVRGGQFDLAYGIEQGEGYVLLCCVDFTKTPLSNYEGNSMLFIHWVESLIGEKCYEDAMNYADYSYGYYYSYGMDYNERAIFEGIGSATVPPILLYLGIIVLYLIAILVVYLVLRHKKKSMNLWVVYPLMAAGLAILIFCIGFSTRIYRPVFNAITLITPNGSTLLERSYTGVTVPDNKAYEIGFSAEQSVEYTNLDYSYYYYDNGDEIDYDSYDIGYKYGYDNVEVSLGEMEAMGTEYFMLTAVTPDTRNILFETENGYPSGLSITNNFGCKLENALVVVSGDVYMIGDMEAGETVRYQNLSTDPYDYLYSDGLGGIAMSDENAKTLLGLVFGSASGTYDEYLCQLRAYNAITDYVDNDYSGPEVIFVAIPSEPVASPLQSETNYNERRVEILYMEYNTPSVYANGN